MLEHMLVTVLDMVNRYKYLPEMIVIHVGSSGLSRVTNHQNHMNIKNMVLNCKKIATAACRNTDSFCGFMFSLILMLPFYINWDSQQVARQVRAHSNGVLAKHAQLNGGYIIRHPDTATAMDLGLYDLNNQGDLMEIGYLLMMKDIAQTIVVPFVVAFAHRGSQWQCTMPYKQLEGETTSNNFTAFGHLVRQSALKANKQLQW